MEPSKSQTKRGALVARVCVVCCLVVLCFLLGEPSAFAQDQKISTAEQSAPGNGTNDRANDEAEPVTVEEAPRSDIGGPDEPGAFQDENSDLDLEDLDLSVDLLFEDFDLVVTAGRTAQPRNRASVPISVLTARDIHESGVTSLPQLFDFVPGMDSLAVDRNRWAVGVRGLHQEFSDRTLVLINGRTASNPVYGGTDFQSLPLFLEDIERIEIARGPGGAVWGPNAFNGVINIIAKSPRDTTGFFSTSTLNEFGDTSSQFRFGHDHGQLAWRISAGYENFKSSEDAISDDRFDSRDHGRSNRFDGAAVYDFSDESSLEFGASHVHLDRGSFSFLGLTPDQDERVDNYRAYLKLNHEFNSTTQGYVQWYGTFEDVNQPALWRYDAFDTTIDSQISHQASEDHEMIVGATARFVHIDSSPARSTDLLRDNDFDETWLGVFGLHRWGMTDDLTLESQLRLDWYSETQLDWSGRVALMYQLDEEGREIFRISGARAFRAPQTGLQEIDTERLLLPSPPLPPGTFGSTLFRSDGIDNEEIWSFEMGYSKQLDDSLEWRIDGYVQRYNDLSGGIVFPDPFGVGRILAVIDNVGSANAWGFETELSKEMDRGSYSVWYAYNEFDYQEEPDQNARTFEPATHKVGLRGRMELNEDLAAIANYRYTSESYGFFAEDASEYHRLDLALSMAVADQLGEIQIGVLDVFDETRIAVDSESAGAVFHETPGRTAYVRFQIRY